MIQIKLLGRFSVCRDGVPLSLPNSKKTKALLGFLATSDLPVRRQKLCEIFWDLPDDPRGSLRWSLSKIRRALHQDGFAALDADRETVYLDKAGLDIDKTSLLNIADPSVEETGRLQDVAGSFHGAFMEDLALPNCADFEAWRMAKALEVELGIARVLKELIGRTRSEPGRALKYAHELQRLLPDDETVASIVRDVIDEQRREPPALTAASPTIPEQQAEPPSPSVEGEMEAEAHVSEPPSPAAPNLVKPDRTIACAAVPDLTRERRQISVLALELSESQTPIDDLDVEDEADSVMPLLNVLNDAMEEFGGRRIVETSSGMAVVFGLDQGTEEHAYQACRAALFAADVVAGPKTGEQGAQNLGFRAGIDAGEALVTFGGGGEVSASGAVIRIANHMAQCLGSNGILISSRAHEAAGGYVETVDLEDGDVRGLSESWGARRLKGEAGGLSRWELRVPRKLSPFVGRDLERQLLERAWESARQERGRMVGVTGSPGIGKSRLVFEFMASGTLSNVRQVACGALDVERSMSLLLIKKLLLAICGVERTAGPQTRAAALDLKLAAADHLAVHRAALRSLLDLDPESESWTVSSISDRSQRLSDALLALITDDAATAPTILLVEDLQWMDEASAGIFQRLVNALPALSVLVIGTYRSDFAVQWARPDAFEQITLPPLSEHETGSLLQALLSAKDMANSLPADLFALTDGTPFFIEETARALADQEEQGLDDLRLPGSVLSILEANINRLDQADRHVLHATAVIGRRVSGALLEHVTGLAQGSIEGAIERLCDTGFLVETQFHPHRRFRIKHALMQECAYGMVARKNRIAMHLSILDRLEYDDGDEKAAQSLARHARLGESWEKAAEYFLAAAKHALEHSAHGTALRNVDFGLQALDHWPEDEARDRQELAFRKVEGVAQMAAKGWSSETVAAAFDRAAELADRVGDEIERFTVMRGKAQYFMISGRPREAQEIARTCCGIVERTDPDNAELGIETSHMYWTNGFFLGDYTTVLQHAEKAWRLYRPEIHHGLTYKYSGHDPGACCRMFLSLVQTLRGEGEEADKATDDVDALAQRFDHPLTTTLSFWAKSYRALFAQDYEAAERWSVMEIENCQRHKLPFLGAQGQFTQGWAKAHLGNVRDGVELMEAGIAGIRKSGAQMGLPYFLALFAEIRLEQGEADQASKLLGAAFDDAAKSDSRFQYSELLRVKAAMLAKADKNDPGVESLLREAVATAKAQGVGLAELTSAVTLAEHLASAKRSAEARELLLGSNEHLERCKAHPIAARAAALL
ncbi:MAG: AAA family ATPase [Pseudomonadota bacterium]